MEHPIKDTPVTLIGDRLKTGVLTGRTKPGRQCEYWQCYWTIGGMWGFHQWVPCYQIIGLERAI